MLAPDLTYRPDIDGLRAIAVLIVIFFHAGLPNFSGGFVGVDVFFVISGYLITQRIVAGELRGGFSYSKFYKRRIRRLFPAMFVTIIATLIAACFIIEPGTLIQASYSATAAALSLANFFFWGQTGYWDADMWSKPLLHTWTLSVEEQFYLLWPVLIIGLLKFKRGHFLVWLFLLGLASLALTSWLTPKYPAAAFYLMPFRIYEFVIGAACVGFDHRKWREDSVCSATRIALSLAGFIAIAWATITYNEETIFPGWNAAIPALGAAAIIMARNPSGSGFVLRNPVVRYIGLISYSLYLVHWPVLSLAHISSGGLTASLLLILLPGIFILSGLQYHLVEKSFRVPPNANSEHSLGNQVWTFALASMLFISVSSTFVIWRDGFPGRYEYVFKKVATLNYGDVNRQRDRFIDQLCESQVGVFCGSIREGEANIMLVGDSHGVDGYNIARAAYPGINIIAYAEAGCAPFEDLEGLWFLMKEEKCAAKNKALFADIEKYALKVDLVVVSVRLDRKRIPRLVALARKIRETGVDVLILGPGPYFRQPLPKVVLSHGNYATLDQVLREQSNMSTLDYGPQLREGVIDAGATYVSKKTFFCPENFCLAFIPETNDVVTIDQHHLTYDAATAFGEYIRPQVPQLRAKYK